MVRISSGSLTSPTVRLDPHSGAHASGMHREERRVQSTHMPVSRCGEARAQAAVTCWRWQGDVARGKRGLRRSRYAEMVSEAECWKVEEHEPAKPYLWAEMSPPPTRLKRWSAGRWAGYVAPYHCERQRYTYGICRGPEEERSQCPEPAPTRGKRGQRLRPAASPARVKSSA